MLYGICHERLNITMKWCNSFQQCCQDSKMHLLHVLMTLCAAGISCDEVIMEYTHDEFCDICLPLGV